MFRTKIRNYYNYINKNIKENNDENHLFLGSLAGVLSSVTLFSLYNENNEQPTKNQKDIKSMSTGLGLLTLGGFTYHMMKFIKKI